MASFVVGLNSHPVRAADPDTIIVGSTDAAGSLDNADDYDNHGWEILQNIGEGLLRYKVGTIEVEPALATDMPKVSDDGKTYTFTLKDGLVFADGTPITAQTFVDSIKRTQTLKGQVSGLVTNYVDTVTAPDAKTVVIKLLAPLGFFNTLVALPPYYPVNPKLYPNDKLVTFPTSIDGNGAYRLTSYKKDEQGVFEVNPKYAGPAR
jgi:peptide/nickel transport system substrate-binding protein